MRGDLETAIRLAEQAVAAADRLGTDSSGLAERTLGNAIVLPGRRSTPAVEWMDRMVASARATGSPARLAHALYMRSVAATSVGDAQLGSTLAAEAGAAAEECGAPTAHRRGCLRGGPLARRRRARSRPTRRSAGRPSSRGTSATDGSRRSRSRKCCGSTRARATRCGALAGYASVIDTWYRAGDWANQWLSLRHVCGIFAQLGANRSAAVLYGSLAAAGAAAALPFEPSDAERLGQPRRRAAPRARAGRVRRSRARGRSDPRRHHRAVRAGRDPPAHRRRGSGVKDLSALGACGAGARAPSIRHRRPVRPGMTIPDRPNPEATRTSG